MRYCLWVVTTNPKNKNLKSFLFCRWNSQKLKEKKRKEKSQPIITASKVYQVFLCSHVIACILPTSHFQISKHTLSFSVFKLKLLVSASPSLSITLSFKPHFATSMNWWCHHSPPVSNIVPVLSWKYQWRKGQRAGESPSSVKRRKTIDQMAFLGQVQYRPVSINRLEFGIYPGTAKMIPVWLVFNPERNHYVSILADLSEWKIPTVPAGTVRNRLPWLGHMWFTC